MIQSTVSSRMEKTEAEERTKKHRCDSKTGYRMIAWPKAFPQALKQCPKKLDFAASGAVCGRRLVGTWTWASYVYVLPDIIISLLQ